MEMSGSGAGPFSDSGINHELHVASVIVDDQLRVIYISPNLGRAIDINPDPQSVGLGQLSEKLPSIPLKERVAKVMEGGLDVFEDEVVTQNGKHLLVAISSFRIENNRDAQNGAIINLADISALELSERKFRRLSDILPQLIWTNDHKGDANYFNARWYEYSGLTYAESRGLGWQAMVHPEDAATSVAKWKDSLAAGQTFDTEFRLRDSAGRYRWHIGRNVPSKNQHDEVIGWYGTATDVQALKEAQSSLRESEERLRVTMDSATDYAIITTDIDGIITGWSAGAERILGYGRHEIIGSSADIIFIAEDRKKGVPDTEMRHARQFGCANDERWHLRKDGTTFFMSGVMTPIQDKNLTGYVKVARDLTTRRAFEQKLLNSEERYRIALEAAEMIAWDYDIVADKLVWNNETELTGSDDNESRLSLFMSFVYEQDKKYVEEKMKQALEHSDTFQAEFRIYTPQSGELRWMSSYGKALHNEKLEPYRLVGVMYDITKRKILEEQKEEFIGIASHELKTPVTSIKAYAEVLEQMMNEKNDVVTAGLLSRLNSQVDRLNDLIKELLDTTKISEGQLILNPVRFDLNILITERVDELQVISPMHKLRTDFYSDGLITADRDLIGQAVTNLISNAIKYSPKGGDVIITTTRLENKIKVTIQDSGIGIPASHHDKIFERFFRVTTPSVQTFPGMGLGLYITAGIIHRHKGTISVESEPGVGSTFSFILPESPGYNKI